MGSALYRSWSVSRQGLFERCPRAFFFQYYPWDEPDTEELRFLARIKSHEMVVGDSVHWAVATALRAYKRGGAEVEGLAEAAVRKFKETCKFSYWIAQQMREGRKPPNEGTILHSDFYGWNGKAAYELGKENVERCVVNFLRSEHWAFLRATNTADWEEIDPPKARMPHFAFSGSNVRKTTVFSGFDLCFHHGEFSYILDWKSGKRSSSDFQLAVYAMYLSRKTIRAVQIENIRVQTVWLQEPGAWSPWPVSSDLVQLVEERIAAQVQIEEERCRWGTDGLGQTAWLADREAFPPRPEISKCGRCKFARVCAEAAGSPSCPAEKLVDAISSSNER